MKLYLSCSIDVLIASMSKYLYGNSYYYRESIGENVDFLIYEQSIWARRYTWSLLVKEVEGTVEVTIIFTGVDGLVGVEMFRSKRYKEIVKHFRNDNIPFEIDL